LALSPPAAFSFSPAEAPPEGVDSLELPPLGAASLLSLLALSLLEEPADELSPEVVVVLVAVVDVDDVWAAAFSALVSVGGVMFGVLLGTVSEMLLPPHPPRQTPPSSTRHAARAL